ncbi:hypothetical protein CROQUDRAFT_650910 [Cronartium quercuum f. sp. fusiforme G11]|uniref:Uncharacterized protein n=1 Tax=Cronartium quercuum f. sp. fusiforme G11 TaxID=708437 RepID=A0A9P6NXU5_9BASI|nr:hypothetical protein CROQUDRAFT_650910 [Cronartium quercuum f. sp. fusiforme G11]
MSKLQERASHSLTWEAKHGAIFDKKKSQSMHFTTKRNGDHPMLEFGGEILRPKEEIRWLGIWLDPKLLFNNHLWHVMKNGEFILAQLWQINKCYLGLSSKEAKKISDDST